MALDSTAVIEATNVALYAGNAASLAAPDGLITAAGLAAFDWETIPSTQSAGSGSGNEYSLLGHTSEDTEIPITPDITGGDIRNSKQSTSLRRSAVRVTWSIKFPLLQLDNNTLPLLMLGGDATGTDTFGVTKSPSAQETTFFVVLADSEANMGLWIPTGSALPDGDISLAGDGLTEASLVVTVMDDSTSSNLFNIYRDGLGT